MLDSLLFKKGEKRQLSTSAGLVAPPVHQPLSTLLAFSSIMLNRHNKFQTFTFTFSECLPQHLMNYPHSCFLPLFKPLSVGDVVFGSLLLNCCLVQMAHCCICCPSPLITPFEHWLVPLMLFLIAHHVCVCARHGAFLF